jgi:hypothetical protein
VDRGEHGDSFHGIPFTAECTIDGTATPSLDASVESHPCATDAQGWGTRRLFGCMQSLANSWIDDCVEQVGH